MELVDSILSICKTIYGVAENVKANKERCNRVAQRVRALEELISTIKQRGPAKVSPYVNNALRDLCVTLTEARELIVKFAQVSSMKGFLHSSKHGDKFCKINERLNDCFQVLSGALQVEQRSLMMHLYETILQKEAEDDYDNVLPNRRLQLVAPAACSSTSIVPALPSSSGLCGSLQPPAPVTSMPLSTPAGLQNHPVTFPPVPSSPVTMLPPVAVQSFPGYHAVVPSVPFYANVGPFGFHGPVGPVGPFGFHGPVGPVGPAPFMNTSYVAMDNTSVTTRVYMFSSLPGNNPF